MRIQGLFRDEDAVSPVIGVILMVAITVILAAVIAAFVIGVGQEGQEGPPTAKFEFEWEVTDGSNSAGFVTISHDAGDRVPQDLLYVRGQGFRDPSTFDVGDYSSKGPKVTTAGNWPSSVASGPDSTVSSGDTVYVPADRDYRLKIVYQREPTQETATLSEDVGPGAE